MFSIELIPEFETSRDGHCFARLQVGSFSERVAVAALPGRDISDLPAEWHRSLCDLLERGAAVALQTQPNEVWVLYRSGTTVFVQNQLLVPDWPGVLSGDGTVAMVPLRETVSEDGSPISEWQTSTAAIREFLEQCRPPGAT